MSAVFFRLQAFFSFFFLNHIVRIPINRKFCFQLPYHCHFSIIFHAWLYDHIFLVNELHIFGKQYVFGNKTIAGERRCKRTSSKDVVSYDVDARLLSGHLHALCFCGQEVMYDNKEVPENKCVSKICFIA